MADDNQETFISKTKIWSCKYYKAHCLWLNAIVIAIVIYTIVTFAFEFFNEPKSSTDQERLGQFGDFLGGTLNPIFGFLTVCLLLWSVFIQRKELKLTREELEKSSAALNGQLELSNKEYNRKQLEEIIKSYIQSIDAQFSEINIHGNESLSLINILKEKRKDIQNYNKNIAPRIEDIRYHHEFSQQIDRLIEDISSLGNCMRELIHSKTYISSEIVRNYWAKKSITYMTDLSELRIITGTQLNEYKSKFQS